MCHGIGKIKSDILKNRRIRPKIGRKVRKVPDVRQGYHPIREVGQVKAPAIGFHVLPYTLYPYPETRPWREHPEKLLICLCI